MRDRQPGSNCCADARAGSTVEQELQREALEEVSAAPGDVLRRHPQEVAELLIAHPMTRPKLEQRATRRLDPPDGRVIAVPSALGA